jgi:hypothetical protein
MPPACLAPPLADAGDGVDTALRDGITELGLAYVAMAWAEGVARPLARSWCAMDADAGPAKARVCHTFGIRRNKLIDSLARIGWSPPSKRLESSIRRPEQLNESQTAELFEPAPRTKRNICCRRPDRTGLGTTSCP